ncbi:D-alanyl-D-alanine carboxypeptidase (penicillin-binding protein 5/6) [Prauserella shujinwangii]|uniref:D-alanyl-D-alanine carboxypeptidase (Penicillin-binding protein 5/6) n=1 Tax=Prauserella shujinwangii TaxID=1453103 RepID=A0A2T0LKH0_9PSEU|nr:D-alanyl-D-alanine carboxypeptidase family protein [Prauserella shujinwangii]PRX43296.1 D-alanyl-D-alanine carboxypeptidase (penicillin-binding protein 5/6) [Prauserella shujinwangii]
MRSTLTLRLLLVTLLTGLLGLPALPAPAQTVTEPPTAGCPNRELPPPPVDTSEEPPPGEASPAPPPVPATPAGGERMAECGLVLPEGAPAPPRPQTAHAWLLQDLGTGQVLAAKNPHGRYRPASLIKTLLALVVIEELEPTDIVVPTEEDANQECTCVGIVAGAKYTVDDLLHALLMRSGNDVAHALATAVGGVPTAVRKMNELAASLGAGDTRAATPSGLDGPGMMTSAYDMSVIFAYAMRQPEYAAAVGTRHMTFPGGDGPDYPVYNDNKLFGTLPGFLGGKTGFTDDARHTYAGAAERDGKRVAVVLLRAEQRPIRVSEQAQALLEYGFSLASAGTGAVGTVTTAPPPPDTSGVVPGEGGTATSTATAQAEEDPFGTTGWIVTLLVSLIVLVGFVIAHRRGALVQRE